LAEYSHSRLSTFEDCPRKFRYRYVDQIKVDTEGVEAFMGKRVHEILERLYHHVARFGRPPSLAQVLERFRQDWARAWHDNVTIVRIENAPGYYRERGERCLENFYRKNYPFSDGETIAIEQRLQWQLDPDGRYRAVGIVDRIVRRSDGVSRSTTTRPAATRPRRRADEDRQLGLYQLGSSRPTPTRARSSSSGTT
jgi:putative RecB family exonuclease